MGVQGGTCFEKGGHVLKFKFLLYFPLSLGPKAQVPKPSSHVVGIWALRVPQEARS